MASHSKHRVTQKQKNADDNKWYKDRINELIGNGNVNLFGFGNINDKKRMKVNYDLFNNILNVQDFNYVCSPYGSNEIGELPARMVNRDIVSTKIKVLIGMEIRRPFGYKVIAVNPEATTRKEQEKFSRIRDFVISEIMTPIRQSIEQNQYEQNKGKKLTQDEQNQINNQIQQELKTQTPDEVHKYMLREHQDPAEVLASQILEYLSNELKIKDIFNTGWKHSLLSGIEVYWTGILNGNPTLKVVNPLMFNYDRSTDIKFIEDGDWAVCEYRMTPAQIVAAFGDELTEQEIDDLTNRVSTGTSFNFTFDGTANSHYLVSVFHCEWKSYRKIGFLSYTDENGQIQEDIVSEDYKLNKNAGDIGIVWEWIPEKHEGYRIFNDIYVKLRPVPGQHKDLNKLHECKLSYVGTAYDNLNSQVTSAMDRVKAFQYFYNIIQYRIEMLMASDKGKKILMNLNAIPKSLGIDLQKWLYYMDATNVSFVNPAEEGMRGASQDVTNLAKEIDMSLTSQINQYIQLAEYIDKKAGAALGISPQMEANIAATDAVTNTKQSIIQSSTILEPLFELHNIVKGNVLTSLLEVAKVAYSTGEVKNLAYVLDDLSQKMLTLDQEMLDNSSYGLYVTNSSKAFEAKQLVSDLAHAAIQNQTIELSDVIKVLKSDGITEAQEELENSERKKQEAQQNQQLAIEEAKRKAQEDARNFEREKMEHEKEMIILKEQERRETVIQQQTILALGFNEDKDMDKDGTPDVMEVANHALNHKVQTAKIALENEKFQHKKKIDEQKIAIDKEKLQKTK